MAKQKKNKADKTTYIMATECRLDPKLCPDLIQYLDANVSVLSSIQRTTWHLVNKRVFKDKNDLNKYLQKRFNIKTRTANSVISDMEGRHASLLELKKTEMEELDVRIARKQGQIEEIREYLDIMRPLVAANVFKEGSDLKYYRVKKKALFQHKLKLDHMINHRKVLEKQIETGVLSVCFGTKALFKKQYELEKSKFNTHEEWLKDFRANRDKTIYYLARKEEKFGNQMCHLSPTTIDDDIFQITVLDSDKKCGIGAQGFVRFSCCLLELRRQLELHKNKSALRKPLTSRFVKRGNNWYLIIFMNVTKIPIYTQDKAGGVVSMDFNCSFIELTELNHDGNLINKFRLDIPHAGKGDRGLHETRAVIKKAVQYAALVQKPLAIESLNFSRKRAGLLKKRRIGYNQMLSSLNYSQYVQAVIRRCDKDGVELITVSPAYTSLTGKKYMTAMHLTGHEAAAWQIGRRAMGFKLDKNKSKKQIAYEKKSQMDIKARKRRKANKAAITAA